ncbi:phage holin family protein [Bacillus mobilis]|uniref:phage holin family protein n=1 Tax=Bacillus mobilis TaxID=2026190 RepID=UPI00330B0F9D|nr:phage holin family protein [Bacillus mobilis]
MHVTKDTAIIGPVVGFLGGIIDMVYGTQNYLMILALGTVIGFDWITGTEAAHKDGSYASSYGIKGIKRTLTILYIPFMGHILDLAFNLDGVITFFNLLAGGLIWHILKSAIANCSRAGWDKWISQNTLEKLSSEIEAKTTRSETRKKEIMGENE